MHGPPEPEYFYLEPGSRADSLTQAILAACPNSSRFEVRDHRQIEQEPVPRQGYDTRIKQEVLILARHPGPFVRPFPGHSRAGEEAAYLIAHAYGCPFDCAYCFLQSYFEHGAPVLFTNREDLLRELATHLQAQPRDRTATYHAGEFSDALALEARSRFAADAIPLFRDYPHARLELRTKCAGVEALLPADPPPNVVVSWTLTPQTAWRRYEAGTPEPVRRLISARACQDLGYRVGIRLDPALLLPAWEREYEELLEEVFRHLVPAGIESFVLGGFRFTSVLANRIRQRFPGCGLLRAESVLCRDGKHRYFRPLRVRLYRTIIRAVLAHDPKAVVRLCMETDQVHQEVRTGTTGGAGRHVSAQHRNRTNPPAGH